MIQPETPNKIQEEKYYSNQTSNIFLVKVLNIPCYKLTVSIVCFPHLSFRSLTKRYSAVVYPCICSTTVVPYAKLFRVSVRLRLPSRCLDEQWDFDCKPYSMLSGDSSCESSNSQTSHIQRQTWLSICSHKYTINQP